MVKQLCSQANDVDVDDVDDAMKYDVAAAL